MESTANILTEQEIKTTIKSSSISKFQQLGNGMNEDGDDEVNLFGGIKSSSFLPEHQSVSDASPLVEMSHQSGITQSNYSPSMLTNPSFQSMSSNNPSNHLNIISSSQSNNVHIIYLLVH